MLVGMVVCVLCNCLCDVVVSIVLCMDGELWGGGGGGGVGGGGGGGGGSMASKGSGQEGENKC